MAAMVKNAKMEDVNNDMLESLKANRNFYFVSRRRPLEYHVGANVMENNNSIKPYHFSGATLDTIRMCSTMIKGPCCDWHHHSENASFILPQRDESEEPEMAGMLQDVEDQIRKLYHPRDIDVEITYEGQYETVTITEFVVQDSASKGFVEDVREELEEKIQIVEQSKRSNNKQTTRRSSITDNNNTLDMEMMDLQCMLSCLPENELTHNPFTGEAVTKADSSSKTVCTASVSLFFDPTGRILNEDFWHAENARVTECRLEDLAPKASAPWLDYTPKNPGSLQLSFIQSRSAVQPLVDSCLETIRSMKHDRYSSPLPLLTYLEAGKRFPSNYQQRKALTIHYELLRDEEQQCKRSRKLAFNMHDAYRGGGSIASTKIIGSQIEVEAKLQLRVGEKSSLTITTVGPRNRTLGSRTIRFHTKFAEASPRIVHVDNFSIISRQLVLSVPMPNIKGGKPHENDDTLSIKITNGSFQSC